MTEQEFHTKRTAFICIAGTLYDVGDLSHEEYLKTQVPNNLKMVNRLMDKCVRGYVYHDDNGPFISLYVGRDFEAPTSIPVEVLDMALRLGIKEIRLGCVVGKVGEVWPPIRVIKL